MARVDIIIPTYNRATVLPETLKSVQAQTFSDWRCFIAEDGETAETMAAVEPFLRDGRFIYLPGKHTGKPAAPRNRAIRSGDAPFVAFLDDDDLWLPEKLEHQIRFMEQHPNCILLGSNAYIWNGAAPRDGDLPLFFSSPVSGIISVEALAETDFIINCTAIVRRTVFSQAGLLNEAVALASVEDYEFWLRIAPLGEVWVQDKPLAIYRDTPRASVRAGLTMPVTYKKLAAVFDAALRGNGTIPSPLAREGNRRRVYLFRNKRDFYRYHAGSFLGWRHAYFRIAAEFRNLFLKITSFVL